MQAFGRSTKEPEVQGGPFQDEVAPVKSWELLS